MHGFDNLAQECSYFLFLVSIIVFLRIKYTSNMALRYDSDVNDVTVPHV